MTLLTYADLAQRWGVRESTLMVWKSRGQLPAPDLVLGRTPAWTEETISRLEDTDARFRKGGG